jgi:cbb3-type cytochrome oxidase subunit 3
VFGQAAGGFGLGLLAFLIGVAGIAAALRTRRRRARYPEAYGSSGGIIYTSIQVGCAGVLLLGGIGLMVLAIAFRK